MQLWMSSEEEADVGNGNGQVRNWLEPTINIILEKTELETGFQKWAFITIILRPERGFEEIIRRHIKRSVIEFRTKIDHEAFLKGTWLDRVELTIKALRQNVVTMARLGISETDRQKLNAVLDKVLDKARKSDPPPLPVGQR